MRAIITLFIFLSSGQTSWGQDSTSILTSAYGEVYYSFDFARPSNHTRPPFIYSHNRTEEVNANLVFLKAAFANEKTRGSIGLMAGTYSNANLAAEPGVLKNIFEANAGFRISKHSQIWVDAGILPSHIGFESAIGKDCWTLTRSIAADNSPYYEAGARLSYTSSEQKWYAALLLLNGWQRIQRIKGNSTPAFGSQLTYKPSKTVLINSSTFVGSDTPDSSRRMRYFHNLYTILRLSERISLTLGFDAGMEQKQKGSSSMNLWYTPVVLLRNQLSSNKAVTIRGEYYQDKDGVIISKQNSHSFSVWGLSSNFDWSVSPQVLWRIEGRWLHGSNPVFAQQNGTFKRANFVATAALCFSF